MDDLACRCRDQVQDVTDQISGTILLTLYEGCKCLSCSNEACRPDDRMIRLTGKVEKIALLWRTILLCLPHERAARNLWLLNRTKGNIKTDTTALISAWPVRLHSESMC